ncbi:DUF2637 domain-containing protein [Actinoplanes sp. NPDC049802]|uniref:DUF2637 domain-containing protein n=1 Tax=Actinoplanes sp. NPDC049802 TaxID=3154742 RepID=UPI0033F76883
MQPAVPRLSKEHQVSQKSAGPFQPLRRPSRADAVFEVVAVIGTLAVSAAAAAASFHGLRHVGETMAHLPPNLSWTVPAAFDGLSAVASMVTLVMTRTGGPTFYPWCVVIGSAVVSSAANALSAPGANVFGQTILAALPLALALALHLLLVLVETRLHRADRTASTPAHQMTVPAPVSVRPKPVPEPRLLPTQRPVIPAPVKETAPIEDEPDGAEPGTTADKSSEAVPVDDEPQPDEEPGDVESKSAGDAITEILAGPQPQNTAEPTAPALDLAALAHQAIQDLADQGRLTGREDEWRSVLEHQPLLAGYRRPRRQISGRIATWRKAQGLNA